MEKIFKTEFFQSVDLSEKEDECYERFEIISEKIEFAKEDLRKKKQEYIDMLKDEGFYCETIGPLYCFKEDGKFYLREDIRILRRI
jgi:hypothetical protein